MLLDNENQNLKVHEWITKYTEQGKLSIVTGYFTISALAYLTRKTNELIDEYKFILGDIVNISDDKYNSLDLLNENISIDASLKLNNLAKEAVAFLELDKVQAKTLEPNFCHAKVYLYFNHVKEPQKNYYISGSSNLTEAGIGLKTTHNVELNIASFGSDPQYNELVQWFNELWKKPQAHNNKFLKDENGKEYRVPFKQYLIDEIKKIFTEYTPRQLYYKILFELFGDELLLEKSNPEFNRQIGRLENTEIYNSLYEFQKKGVLSLIKMLQKYNGAILADAVGLGKTWTALAVMKFYLLQGREVILVCPKKLHYNWHAYLRNQNSRFEKDQFEYFIRFHTDMQEDRLEKHQDRADFTFTNDKSKLFVIDESHHFRNDKSKRYKYFVEKILQKNGDIKVLMLSATPINNSLLDIRNQFKLIVAGNVHGFEESLDIRNLDYTFRAAQKTFNDWANNPHPRMGDFIRSLPPSFFRLTDSLTVARTRTMIQEYQDGLKFPQKEKPENIFITPKQIGNFESFEELFDHFPPMLSGYQPAFYIEQAKDVEKIYDERQRDRFLVKMMYILLVKRLESSWFAFKLTVNKVLEHHQNALNRILAYQNHQKDNEIDADQGNLFEEDDDLADELEQFTLGKKRKICLSEIEAAGNLNKYKKDLKKDIEAMQLLQSNLIQFEKRIEVEIKKPRNYKSDDDKLQMLISKIEQKTKKASNHGNPKVLIFTVYYDTALYLFEQLKARGFTKLAMISGDYSRTWDSKVETKKFEPILERFAPFTKLFREKEWEFKPSKDDLTFSAQYREWQEWIAQNDLKTHDKLQNPIDILIATDVLSEGQNLQDCDLVVNYDIHWNPVRVIQRMGRIDRLGSPNECIFGVNFWPSNNINSYLNLQGRIEQRMAAMKLAGSEVNHEFSDSFREMAESDALEQKQNAIMLEQMQVSWDDIEVNEQSLGFDDLSLEIYRQDLLEELDNFKSFYQFMPKGVYTGFKKVSEQCPEKGLIALLGYPARLPKKENHQYRSYEFIYIDENGEQVLQNHKEILEALAIHKDEARFVPKAIDPEDAQAIHKLSAQLEKWLQSQAVTLEVQDDGAVKERMGSSTLDIIEKLKKGKRSAINTIQTDGKIRDKYKKENFDLITWFIVS